MENHVVNTEEEEERRQWEGFAEKECICVFLFTIVDFIRYSSYITYEIDEIKQKHDSKQ